MERVPPIFLHRLLKVYHSAVALETAEIASRSAENAALRFFAGGSGRAQALPTKEKNSAGFSRDPDVWWGTPEQLKQLALEFHQNGLDAPAECLEDFARNHKRFDVRTDLPQLQTLIIYALKAITLVRIPADRLRFYQIDLAQWRAAMDRFAIQVDVKAAGSCIAFDNNTGAVFHMMRVVEVGLRYLVRHLRLGRKVKRPLPTWNDYLTAIENKFRFVPAPGKKKRRKKNEIVAKQALTYIQNIRDAWRGEVVHQPASEYSPNQAMAVFENVMGLMQHLATKLK